MDQLRALRYFVAVADAGSFTRAAEHFSVPPSSLSRRVSDLERSLGAVLLKRSTRVVQLSEIGQRYFEQVEDILAQLELADEGVRNYQAKPTGHLRISSLVSFGERILLPLLDEFTKLYPEIILDVSLSDDLASLARDDVDLAIRGGYAPNERVVAIKLMNNTFVPVAAPKYLAERGTPVHPLDLCEHQGLYFRTPNGPTPWICELNGQWQEVSPPLVAASNNGKWLADKAVQGQGIMMAPSWAVQDYLRSGELVELTIEPRLSITQNTDLAIYLLYQKPLYQLPKVKAAVDFLAARIKGRY